MVVSGQVILGVSFTLVPARACDAFGVDYGALGVIAFSFSGDAS